MKITEFVKSHQKYIYAIIFLSALFLRLWDIGARSLWYDEAIEFWSANVPITYLFESVKSSYQPPLFSVLLHFWIKVSANPVWMRLISVIFSLMSIVGIIVVSKRTIGFWGSLVAGIIMAILPSEIRYAQEVAEYALMECMLIWSLGFLLRTIEYPSIKNFLFWGLFSILSMYSHYGAFIVVFSSTFVILMANVLKKQWKSILKILIVAISCLVLGLPLLFFFLPAQLQAQGFQANFLSFTGIKNEILNFFTSLFHTLLFPITGWPFSDLTEILGVLPIVIILVFSFMILISRNKQMSLILIWFWVAYLIYYIFVRTRLYAYGGFGFRYGMILVPLIVLLVSAEITSLIIQFQSKKNIKRFFWGSIVFLITTSIFAIICLSLYSLPNRSISAVTRGNTPWPETEDMKEIVSVWKERREKSEATYLYYGAVPSFNYYLRYVDNINALIPQSYWIRDCIGESIYDYCTQENIFHGKWVRSLPVNQQLESIEKSMGGWPRNFWIIFSHVYPGEDLLIIEALETRYKIIEEVSFQGASMYHLQIPK